MPRKTQLLSKPHESYRVVVRVLNIEDDRGFSFRVMVRREAPRQGLAIWSWKLALGSWRVMALHAGTGWASAEKAALLLSGFGLDHVR